MMTIQDLLDLSKTIAAPLFAGKTYPWEALAEIGDFILQLGPTLPAEVYEQRGENIWIARDAKIFDSAYIACREIQTKNFIRQRKIMFHRVALWISVVLHTASPQSFFIHPSL